MTKIQFVTFSSPTHFRHHSSLTPLQYQLDVLTICIYLRIVFFMTPLRVWWVRFYIRTLSSFSNFCYITFHSRLQKLLQYAEILYDCNLKIVNVISLKIVVSVFSGNSRKTFVIVFYNCKFISWICSTCLVSTLLNVTEIHRKLNWHLLNQEKLERRSVGVCVYVCVCMCVYVCGCGCARERVEREEK